MKSLVEAIANIVLFILTPMIVGVGTGQLSSGHREHRELPVEESETRAVCHRAGISEEAMLNTEPFLCRTDGSRP